jgi:hypothetical protein
MTDTTGAGAALPNEMFLPVFEEVVDWQLNILRRYPTATLTVVVLEPRLDHQADVNAQEATLTAFRQALCRGIRASDLVAQGLASEVWLLLPHSDGEGALARLREMFEATPTPLFRSATLDLQYGQVLPDHAHQLMGDLRRKLA